MKIPNIFEAGTPTVARSAGEDIFRSGDAGEEMYVVKSGEVELIVGDKVMEVVGEEGIFGEMALIEAGPRAATARAKTDCVLLPINQKRFEFMVHEVPEFALVVMRVLSRRLRRLNELV